MLQRLCGSVSQGGSKIDGSRIFKSEEFPVSNHRKLWHASHTVSNLHRSGKVAGARKLWSSGDCINAYHHPDLDCSEQF